MVYLFESKVDRWYIRLERGFLGNRDNEIAEFLTETERKTTKEYEYAKHIARRMLSTSAFSLGG